MICKQCSYENSEDAKFCSNCGAALTEEIMEESANDEDVISGPAETETQEEPVVVEVEETTLEEPKEEEAKPQEAQWYYVANNASTGPFTEMEMKAFIDQGVIKGTTYVWKNGMEDWVLLKHSELARYLKAETEARDPMSGNVNPQAQRTFYASPVQERSIALNVILTIVTCGIYGLVWLYLLAKDVNELSAAQGKPQMTDPILVVLLSIMTCGLYEIYFFYQAGKAMYNLDSKVRLGDDSTLLAILAIFAEIVSMAILQNSINTFVRYGE